MATDNIIDSSPVQIEGDTMAVLQEYYDWQMVKNPPQKSQL